MKTNYHEGCGMKKLIAMLCGLTLAASVSAQESHAYLVLSVAFSPDGTQVLSCSGMPKPDRNFNFLKEAIMKRTIIGTVLLPLITFCAFNQPGYDDEKHFAVRSVDGGQAVRIIDYLGS
jgi:hypothetical protein